MPMKLVGIGRRSPSWKDPCVSHRGHMISLLSAHLDLFVAGAGESFTRRSASRVLLSAPTRLALTLRLRFFGRVAASRSPGSNTKSGSTVLECYQRTALTRNA